MAQAAELMSRAKVPMRMQPRGGDPLLRAVVGCGVQWPNESKEGRDVARKRLTPSSRSEAMMLASSLDAELGEAADLRRQMLAYDKAFAELVRQVHLHCAERGALLERCRVQQHAWTTRLLLALKVCDRSIARSIDTVCTCLPTGHVHTHTASTCALRARVRLLLSLQEIRASRDEAVRSAREEAQRQEERLASQLGLTQLLQREAQPHV